MVTGADNVVVEAEFSCAAAAAVDFLLRFFFWVSLLAPLSVAAKSRPGMWRGCGC